MVAMSETGLQRAGRTPSQRQSGGGDDVLRQMRGKALDVAERVRSGTREVKEQVMQKASELTRAVTDGVKEEAERFFDEQKGKLGARAQRVSKVINQAAHALHAVKADGIAEAVDAAAGRVEQASSYIAERSLGELIGDAEDVARQHPALMLGGLFAAGLIAARFVKASASREESTGDAPEPAGARRAGRRTSASSHGGRNGRASRGR